MPVIKGDAINVYIMHSEHYNSLICILADIGGTYARFGILGSEGCIHTCRKYEIRSFDGPEQALDYYRMQADCTDLPRDMAIATAAWPYTPDKWYFARDDTWCIELYSLQSAGWHIRHIENDFTASARGALLTSEDNVTKLYTPETMSATDGTALVIGVGTGLGLAYARQNTNGEIVVRPTCGGHMPPPRCGDDEISTLVETALSLCDQKREAVIEDLVSGPGLRNLIRAAGIHNGSDPGEMALETPAIIPPDFLEPALRVFHTLLGLFINEAAQFGYAFGRVYLDGGIIGLLRDNNMLDIATIRTAMCRDSVQVIQDNLDAMPIYGINDPLISFTGLKACLADTQKNQHMASAL